MRYLPVLLMLLLMRVPFVAADDIDIYSSDSIPRKVPVYVILAVDLQGAQRSGKLDQVADSLASALSVLSARQLAPTGQATGSIALLEPASGGSDWRLGEFRDLAETATPEFISDAMLTAAQEPSPELQLAEVYETISRELAAGTAQVPACVQFLVVNLLFDTPPDVAGGTFHKAPSIPGYQLRSRYISSRHLPLLEQVALANGSEVLVASPGEAMTRTQSGSISDVWSGSATLLSTTVPGGLAAQDGSRAGDAFIALFEPRPGRPWAGNLKKLRMVRGADGRFLLTQAGSGEALVPALDPDDGRIRADALTFWTDPQGADVQAFDPERGEVAGRDGRSVTRGGAGQRIPGFLAGRVGSSNGETGARQVYALPANVGQELQALNIDPVLLTELGPLLDPGGVLDEQKRLSLLAFIRGLDVFDEDLDGDTQENRSWLLGAVMHSQPLLLNYGVQPGAVTPDERIVFGSNDGALHMLRNNAAPGRGAGEESWAILPREMLARQAIYAGLKAAGPGFTYGVDGSPVASIRDRDSDGVIETDDGDRVWVFFGLRRGGRGLYALDVSEPDRPELLWQITGGQGDFEQLGLGFSTPRVVLLDLGESVPREALLFAGGYNGGWQGQRRLGKDGTDGPDAVGNAIYVVDATTGALIWRAIGPGGGSVESGDVPGFSQPRMLHSIPAPLAPVDSNGNGAVDRAYVADTGGSLWRLDLPEAGSGYRGDLGELLGRWRVVRIAQLGGAGADDRRFFHQVDYVRSRDEGGDYDGILLASGNRTSPGELLVENYAYLVKDRGETTVTHDGLTDISQACARPDIEDCRTADLLPGWKLALDGIGEKGLSRPLVSRGTVYFTSYRPATLEEGACTITPGRGRVYAVRLADGAPAMGHRFKWDLDPDHEPGSEPEPVRSIDAGPGIPGPVMPWRDLLLLPGAANSGEELFDPGGAVRWRIFWREEGVDVQ